MEQARHQRQRHSDQLLIVAVVVLHERQSRLVGRPADAASARPPRKLNRAKLPKKDA